MDCDNGVYSVFLDGLESENGEMSLFFLCVALEYIGWRLFYRLIRENTVCGKLSLSEIMCGLC